MREQTAQESYILNLERRCAEIVGWHEVEPCYSRMDDTWRLTGIPPAHAADEHANGLVPVYSRSHDASRSLLSYLPDKDRGHFLMSIRRKLAARNEHSAMWGAITASPLEIAEAFSACFLNL